MSECCLPNLGCLNIPITYIDVAGQAGQNGTDGRGILNENYEPSNGELTLTFTDNTTYTTGDLRGAQGDVGLQGVNGVSRLYTNLTDSITSVINDWQDMSTYNIEANALINDGDSVVIRVRCLKTLNSNNVLNVRYRVLFNALSCTSFGGFEPFLSSTLDTTTQYELVVEIIKKSSSTALCIVSADVSVSVGGSGAVGTSRYQNELTGLNFGIQNTLYSQLYQEVANQIRFKSVTIDKITAV